MLRKFGCFVVLLGLTLSGRADPKPGTISGYVRSAAGVPQMGAVVEVLGAAMGSLKVFTDDKGFYVAGGLQPGFYSLKVSAPSFLTSEHQPVGLHAGAVMVLNVTLATLFDSIRLAPSRIAADDDDWKWVLRSSANRPILRVLDPSQTALRAESPRENNKDNNHNVTGTLSFVAGSQSQGFGGASDVSTDFSLQRSLFSTGTISLRGNVGYGETAPDTVLRASYSRQTGNGSHPQIALTFRKLASPELHLRDASLQALGVTTSDTLTLENLDLNFGSELQAVQFMGRVSAVRPFGTADFHLSPDAVIEYRYATSEPNSGMEKDLGVSPSDVDESAPRMSIAGSVPALQHSHHQELSISGRAGNNNLQFAVYSDRISDPALTGVGASLADNGQILNDVFSGTFTYRGKNLDTRGTRIVFERKLKSDVTATLDYSYGGVLDLRSHDVTLADARQSSVTRNRHSATVKMSGTIPVAKSQWIASYGWVGGQALTRVDMFNASAGRADPYLDVFFRQPIPGGGFIPAHMEALIEVRNLLAQGYVPVLAGDGQTVYLVQSARSVRGGVAFSF